MSLLLFATILILTFSGHCFLVYTTLGRYSWRKICLCPSVCVTGIRVVSVESSLMDTFLNSNAKRSFWNIQKKSSERNLKKCTEITFIVDVWRPDDPLVEKSRAAHDHTMSVWILLWPVLKWTPTEFVWNLKSKRAIPSSSSSSCVYLGRDGERKLLAVAAIRDRNADDDDDYGRIRHYPFFAYDLILFEKKKRLFLFVFVPRSDVTRKTCTFFRFRPIFYALV